MAGLLVCFIDDEFTATLRPLLVSCGCLVVNEPLSIAVCSIVAYLAGSTPFGLIVARLVAGIDIRKAGSGNIGATNVGRTLGAKWGIVVLLLDAAKGLLPTLLLPICLKSAETQNEELLAVVAGVSTIVGHMFPAWLGFRGGKGVATSLGVVTVLAPWGTLVALGGFTLSVLATRIVALASIVAAVAFAICQMWILAPRPFAEGHLAVAIFSLTIPLLVIARHRGNIGRLLRGEEKKFSFANKQPTPTDEPGTNNETTSEG